MARDEFRWNMAELVNLTNEVLAADCIPLANQVADRARASAPVGETGDYKASIHVETDKRTSESDFAHAYVVSDSPYAGVVEARTGNLVRALNSAG